jgi:hypothetical protein
MRSQTAIRSVESERRLGVALEHNLDREPVSTFRDHALGEVAIVAAKIAVVIILVLILVLVLVGLVLGVLVPVLILVPLLLSQIAMANTADPAGVRQAGMIAEHRADAVKQEAAADHPRGRRCGRAEKRSARSKGRPHARTRRIGRRLRRISGL